MKYFLLKGFRGFPRVTLETFHDIVPRRYRNYNKFGDKKMAKSIMILKFLVIALLSPRFWVPLFVLVGLAFWAGFTNDWVTSVYPWLVTAGVVIASMTFVATIMGVYSVTGVTAFISDFLADLLFFSFAFGAGVVLITLYFSQNTPLTGLVFVVIALMLSLADIVVSVFGGASKLLEMDKVRTETKL